MKKIFISPVFWAVYTILYFILMMVASVIAEGHMIGGGGNSDITVWAFQWHWDSVAEMNCVDMFCFLLILIFPWLFSIKIPPKGRIYSALLILHFIFGLFLLIIHVGGVLYGLTADTDVHFDDWSGEGIYPSPVDKYTSLILLNFFGPILFVYGGIVVMIRLIRLWSKK
ncbi:MAG: hypothetical protein IJB46_03935 [Prevotella sp.]|nr:hypothetical protein [Prevotella sp.]